MAFYKDVEHSISPHKEGIQRVDNRNFMCRFIFWQGQSKSVLITANDISRFPETKHVNHGDESIIMIEKGSSFQG